VTPYYSHAGIEIYHGDCREVMPGLGPVDAVITDPPYGIAVKSHGHWFVNAAAIAGDESMGVGQWAIDAVRPLKTPLCVFASPYKPWPGEWRNVLAWDKGEHVGIGGDRETCWKRTVELIQIANNKPLPGKRDGAVLRFNAVSPPPSGHVAEKPVELMRYLVGKLSSPGDTILDPFMGSGTTLVAAKQLGRKAIGIEIEERYCEISARRLAQEVLPL
jgi:site-specific DNA-methyltransferase (adenine-specific)